MLSKSLLLVAGLLVTSLSTLPDTASAHMAISYPRGQAGPWTNDPVQGVHAWIGYKGKKMQCGNYKPGPVTKLKAGQRIDVEFWNYDRGDWNKWPPKNGTPQGRHGGGACEFSLSNDGGKTWRVIGQYTKTCPDLTYKWPVKIPYNVADCKDSKKCLFSWTWIAYKTNQFYHHCANVEIESDPKLASAKRTFLQSKSLGFSFTEVDTKGKRDTSALGDGAKGRSSGPNKDEVTRNLSDYYANGGKSINLMLRRNGKMTKRYDHDDEAEARYFREAALRKKRLSESDA